MDAHASRRWGVVARRLRDHSRDLGIEDHRAPSAASLFAFVSSMPYVRGLVGWIELLDSVSR